MQKWPDTTVTLIGVPLDLGAKNLGVADGPDAFRQQDITGKLASAGINLQDSGDIMPRDRDQLDPGDPHLRYLDEIVRVSEEIAAQTQEVTARQERVVALGGDHSINLGVVAGASTALSGDLGLIYLDAHGDINTPETTQTGNIHGMHLAALLGFGDPRLVNVHAGGAKISKEHLLHIGGSDLDQPEIELMQRENLPHFTLVDLLTDGMRPLFQKIDELSAKVNNIWISLDLDVIDRVYAPGAGMPNPGGLSYREIAAIAERIGTQCNVIGIDVVEYNPSQDENGKTAELAIELIAKFFGKNYSWYTGYLAANKL